MSDLRAAVDDLDENLDEALGHAADSIWSFATSVTGKVSSVVDQPGLETLRKNVTSRLAPLDNIGRDLQSSLGALAPDENSIANLAGSVKSVAASVQRNAEMMEKAILAKANQTSDTSRHIPQDVMDCPAELAVDDNAIGVVPVVEPTDTLDVNEEIAKVGETISNSLGQVGGLWSGLWGKGPDEQDMEPSVAPQVQRTRFEKRIFELQANPDTYCEPAKDLDAFGKWTTDFSLDDHTDDCIQLLTSHDSIAELYERVVPRIVDEDTFWMRYFFAKHVLEVEEQRRKKLLERAGNVVVEQEDEEDGWGDDDWGDDVAAKVEKEENPAIETRDSSQDNNGEQNKDHTETTSDNLASINNETVEKEGSSGEDKSAKTSKDDKSAVKMTPIAQVAEVQGKEDDDWGDDDWE